MSYDLLRNRRKGFLYLPLFVCCLGFFLWGTPLVKAYDMGNVPVSLPTDQSIAGDLVTLDQLFIGQDTNGNIFYLYFDSSTVKIEVDDTTFGESQLVVKNKPNNNDPMRYCYTYAQDYDQYGLGCLANSNPEATWFYFQLQNIRNVGFILKNEDGDTISNTVYQLNGLQVQESSIVPDSPIFDYSNCGSTDIGCYLSQTVDGIWNWLFDLIIPQPSFFGDRWTNIKTLLETKFPIFSDINSAISANNPASAVIQISGLSLAGQTLPSITLFDPQELYNRDPDLFSFVRFLLATILYANTAWVIMLHLRKIMSS